MREPTQARVPSGMGTQAANHHSNKLAWINNKTSQDPQNYMETEQTYQYNINITHINPIPTETNTDSFYNSWGDTLPNPKPASTVHLALQNFSGWPQ